MYGSTIPVIFITVILTLIFIIYLVLVVRFLVRRSRKKGEQNTKEDEKLEALFPYVSPISAFRAPHRLMQSRSVPVQPRTYEDLSRSEENLQDEGNLVSIPEKVAGKLKFSVHYDSIRATLSVKLHRAQGLPQMKKGDVSYYVILKIIPQNHRSFQSRAVKGTNPEFKELFEFRVPYEKLQKQSLKLTVSYFDLFSQHETVGDLMVHLAELEKRGLNLCREVLLVRYIHAAPKATGALGEVMLSLGYLRLTERLTVVIISARNLCSLEEGQPPDAYVEVFVYHAGRKLKEKRTSVTRTNHCPVFNEALTFHIPLGILHQTSLLLCVMHDEQGRGQDKLLGQVFLGPESTGSQFEHWNEMRVNNKPIARWHKLFE